MEGLDYEKVLQENLSESAFAVISNSEKDFADWVDRVKYHSKRCDELSDELKAYKDLEEHGLLLRLPCKLGDTLYWVSEEDADGNKIPTIKETEPVAEIAIRKDGFYVNTDGCESEDDKLGSIYAILTREEAEAKLKEMEKEWQKQ